MDPYYANMGTPAEQLARHQLSAAQSAREDARQAAREERTLLEAQAETLEGIQAATLQVHAEVERLVDETGRAQRLALWVGVGTAMGGAIIGGFAGAVAARVVGG